MRRLHIFLSLLIVIGFTSCQNKEGGSQVVEIRKTYTCPMHPQIREDQPGSCPICGMNLVEIKTTIDPTEVALNKSQIALANITVEPITYQSIGSSLILNGKIKTDEAGTEIVSTRVPGRLDRLYIKETGVRLNKGQPIYEIYSEQLLTYEQEYLLAIDQNKVIGGSPSKAYLEAAKRKLWLYGMTEEQIKELADKKVPNARIQFVSPASGVITEINVVEGQYVAEGTAIYRLENLSHVWVEAELYPNEASLLKMGDLVTIRVNGFEQNPIVSKVNFIDPEFRQSTQIFVMRTSISNPDHSFIPGMQAEIIFEHTKKRALTLPNDAVIREENGSLVYVKSGEGKFKARMVSLGLQNFDKVEITEGLNEGDSIVVTGAYLLYSEVILKKGVNPLAVHYAEGQEPQHMSLKKP